MVEIKRKHGRVEPRSRFSLFIANHGWIALVAAIVLMALTYFSVLSLREAEQFETVGVMTQATILEKRSTSSGEDTNYFATFSFASSENRVTTKEHKVNRLFYRRVSEGAKVTIRYLPDDPADFEYYIGENRRTKWVAQIFALISGIGGLLALWLAGKRANMAVLARRYGEIGVGEVISVERVNNLDGEPTNKSKLIWKGNAGRRCAGMPHPMKVLQRYKKGDKIRIFTRDGESWWEGDVGPRKLD